MKKNLHTQCKYCLPSNQVDSSQFKTAVSASLPPVSTPTLLHPSACSVMELIKDLDKADLLSLTQTESWGVIEEVIHSGTWVILRVLDVKGKMQSQQKREPIIWAQTVRVEKIKLLYNTYTFQTSAEQLSVICSVNYHFRLIVPMQLNTEMKKS